MATAFLPSCASRSSTLSEVQFWKPKACTFLKSELGGDAFLYFSETDNTTSTASLRSGWPGVQR